VQKETFTLHELENTRFPEPCREAFIKSIYERGERERFRDLFIEQMRESSERAER